MNGQNYNGYEASRKVTEFYTRLYNKKPRECSWAYRPDTTLSEQEKTGLAQEIPMAEFTRVLMNCLANGKSPGNDGLTIGLYRVLWKELNGPYLAMLKDTITQSKMQASQSQSIVCLIPKKG